MDVEITKANGSSYRLSDHDVVIRDFVVSSIEMRPSYSGIDGRHGYVDMGATYGSRTIRIPFYLDAHDLLDVALLRDKLFELVTDVDSFYIRELRRSKYAPMHVCDDGESDDYEDKYVGGKRYKVRLTSTAFEIEQMFTYGFGELTFETTDLPFSESIGTTADIDSNGLRYSDELWSYGMGLLYDNESHRYTHSSRSFEIYNAGNVPIHPFQQELKISILGAGKGFELRNRTTGDVFRLTDQINGVIVIDGANITDNSIQALRKTNRQFITIAPGWNEFTQNGTARISFDFRFYYL